MSIAKKMDMDWLKAEFNKVKVYQQIFKKAEELQQKMMTVLSKKLKSDRWKLSEFLVMAMALHFVRDLLKNGKSVPSININERAAGVWIKRDLLFTDVDELIRKIEWFYQEKLNILEKLAVERNLPKIAPSNQWLNLFMVDAAHDLMVPNHIINYEITSYNPPITVERILSAGSRDLVTEHMEKEIRYAAFGLKTGDEVSVNNKTPFTFTINELARRWKTNRNNVMAACINTKHFCCYLNLGDEMKLCDFSHKKTVAWIDDADADEIDKKYKYALPGYARLARKTILKDAVALRYFQSHRVVKSSKKHLARIWIEPPLCKRVMGVYSQYVESVNDLKPILFFMQDEIHEFENSPAFAQLFPECQHLMSDKTKDDLKKHKRKLSAKKSGKLSGQFRKEAADLLWEREKPAILKLAKDSPGYYTANHLAGVAVNKFISSRSQSGLAKYIRDDKDIVSHLKPNDR